MGELPVQEGTETLESELIPKGKAVEKYAEPRTSLKILPEGYEYLENDRPDLETDDIIIVDENGYFIPKPDFLPESSFRALPEGYEYMENDRPDLDFSLIITDGNGYYIPENGRAGNTIEDLKKLITYSYFGEVDGYPVESVKDLNTYYSQWDDIMANDSAYITKSTLSPSGLLNLPIYRYDFKPSDPKLKVMLAGCTHGWEKNFSFGLRVFMKQLTENWKGNEALTFLRQNVHFIVVPVVSPDPFVTNPFNGSVRIRDRAGYETPPFNASWTKSGTVVTITFNSSDFPSNSRVSASNYFTARPSGEIVNKVGVTLFESSNLDELPDDVYDIKSVIDARTITINTPTSGSGSGTIKMCVKSDVNRNAGTASWGSLGHSPTSKIGYPVGYYDNKGTTPFSLAETTNIKNILEANRDIAFYYDFHSGAGDYVTYISYPAGNKDTSFDFLSYIYRNLFGFTPEYRIGDDYSALFVFAKESNGIIGSNPEWHAPEVETGVMDSQQATDMHNWIGNLLTISSKINLLNR
ncbi:M14 family zinc carboxypeptidase [Sphingobacterium sp.]|uniref:M14 family zinc carboxypeptidase n=1 Tax=Sphingobacterium sp. TaxID=341027 RepID=UPI0028A6BB0A|nr:M14 family zinc carboxypeptidase [Sphingobacterium sp.]